MPSLDFKHSILNYIQELHGVQHKADEWPEWLPEIGCPVDGNDQESIEVEVFPDRPDLLSHETIARASRSFLSLAEVGVDLPVTHGEIRLSVEPELKNVRPIVMGAVVRGVMTGKNHEEREDFIQSLMDHQEKLHMTIGRKRKFASIGVHDLTSLEPPFRVTTVSPTYSFVPLACSEEMTIKQVLSEHPKGMEYAHLMEGLDRFPVIIDSADRVLSFPPIINGSHTTVHEGTQDFFIDVTGWDERACESCLLLVCLSMSERGGRIESIEFAGIDGETKSIPRGESRKHRIPDSLIRKILGLELSSDELSRSIAKMGGRLEESRTVTNGPNEPGRWADCVVGEIEHIISMPRWRSDIMHPVDVVEDIAIGFGFENLPIKLSSTHLDAIPLGDSNLKRRFGESMRACGLQEVQSLTLSNEKDQFENVRWPREDGLVIIANPTTSDHTVLRQYILPSLLRLLAANRHHELPQRVYELGTVVRGSRNYIRGAWTCAEVGNGFTKSKGIVQALLIDLDASVTEIEYKPTEAGHGPWISGRGSQILFQNKKIGEFGEVAPEVSAEFGIKSPIQAGEIDLGAVFKLIPDPIS
jgi:phenylalanyl-tRNA synthetase beta chain